MFQKRAQFFLSDKGGTENISDELDSHNSYAAKIRKKKRTNFLSPYDVTERKKKIVEKKQEINGRWARSDQGGRIQR